MGTIDRGREPPGSRRGDRVCRGSPAETATGGHATNPFLYAKIPYDTFKDFSPISLLASSPNILLVRTDSPFKSVGDVIAAAKAKPGSLSYGHAGNGTSTHLAGELLKNLGEIDLNAIPYKGISG